MDQRVKIFYDFLMDHLSAGDWNNLHTRLGVKKYRVGWLLNEEEYRLDKFKPREIEIIAELTGTDPGRLIIDFGLGHQEMSIAKAREYDIDIYDEKNINKGAKIVKAERAQTA